MEKKIITISREYGSGGRYLGEEVAKRLGFAFYDKEIMAKTAEKTGLSQKYIEEAGEYAPFRNLFAYAFVGRNSEGISLADYTYSVQREIILEAAEQGSCVIVGRCADYILRERKDCLNLFICADQKQKVQRLKELYQLTEEEAEKQMREIDKKRAIHYKYYTEQEWGAAKNYALCLNSSTFGYEQCAELICSLVR